MEKVEFLILRNLIYNEEYTRKVLAYIQEDYFKEYSHKTLFEEIHEFINEYNNPPSKEALLIEIEKRNDLNPQTVSEIHQIISDFENIPVENQWLVDTTEKWCRDQAIYLALMESIQIADGQDEKKNRDSIPSILEKALSVSFDNHVGHDYIEDSDLRFEYYHDLQTKLPFDLEYFNKITKGGVSNKTLNLILGGTNVGKTLIFTSLASSYLKQGKNVLYISLEMAEEEIAKRIDANCLDINIDEIERVSKESFNRKINTFNRKTQGRLIVKEYPTTGASVIHFKSLINELKLKKNFKPDVIFIDYLSICASSRIKRGFANSYEYVGAIAEELRGFAKENDVPIWSGVQANRSNQANSDPTLEAISESAKLGHIADFMLAVISTEELEAMGQYLFKQLKNRYNRKGKLLRFTCGVDYEKMRLYDVDQSTQEEPYAPPEDVEETSSLTTKFNDFVF
jgi:replicative DNA helicase